MHAYLITCLMAMALAGTALAERLDDATAAYNNGDYASAMRLLLPLAADGNRAAQYNLGMMYNEGKGVPQDSAEAIIWLRKAADQGDVEAQYDLGFIYRHGRGVPQNDAEAAKWYRQAAAQGNAIAQFNLGFMYGNGEGMPQNFVEAYRWFTLAAAQLPAADSFNREKAIRNRDVLAREMTPGQIAAAQKLVRDWKPPK